MNSTARYDKNGVKLTERVQLDPEYAARDAAYRATGSIASATPTPTLRPHLPWYCADQRDGRRVHVDARGNTVNGPSRIVHTGGRIECPDGRVAEDARTYVARDESTTTAAPSTSSAAHRH